MAREHHLRSLRARLTAVAAWLLLAARHTARDGIGVAIAFARRTVVAKWPHRPRDPGERAAERFLRALGYTVLRRNWRSPRDPRDEADLVVRSPDGREIVIVEVKRAAGPWDPLARVDGRKRAVLWRLLTDLEAMPPDLRRDVRQADSIRVDLIAVRGEGRGATVVDHDFGFFSRELRHGRSARPP